MSSETVAISSTLEVSVCYFSCSFCFMLFSSLFFFKYIANVEKTLLCSQTLNKDDTKEFQAAIDDLYWYQMYLDDLPLWGMVGLKKSSHEHV